jgi:hypothetical protein
MPTLMTTIMECPHCKDASAKSQRPITDAERNVTGPATLEVRKLKDLNKCARCGCIYDRKTGTKLTFA